jgi:uncharacterized membrane protein YgcG
MLCKKSTLIFGMVWATVLLTNISQPVLGQPTTNQSGPSQTAEAPAAWLKLAVTVPEIQAVDFEKSLNTEMEKQLDSSYHSLFSKTGIKMYFVTIDSLTVTKAQFNEFGFYLMQYWFAGADTNQYGGIVLVSKGLKKIQVYSSKNLDRYISEAEMKYVTGNGFIPGYAAGNFYKGSREGTKLLTETLLKNYTLKNRSSR